MDPGQLIDRLLGLETRQRARVSRGLRADIERLLRSIAAIFAMVAGGIDAVLPDSARGAVRAKVASEIDRIADQLDLTPALRRAVAEGFRLGTEDARLVANVHPGRLRPSPELEAALARANERAREALRAAAEQVRIGQLNRYADLVAAIARANQATHAAERAASWATVRATTEAARAVARRGGAKLLWVAERDACLTCLAYAGKVVGVDEQFRGGLTFGDYSTVQGPTDGPPAHPFCRCRLQPWLGSREGVGPAELPAVLEREAQRAVLRGDAMASEPARLRAADRLLASNQRLLIPRTVERRARDAVARGQFRDHKKPRRNWPPPGGPASVAPPKPKPRPRPKPPQLLDPQVELSDETQREIARVARLLPSSFEDWKSIRHRETAPRERRIDRKMREGKEELERAQAAYDKAAADLEAEFKRKRTPHYKRDDIRRQRLTYGNVGSDLVYAQNEMKLYDKILSTPDWENDSRYKVYADMVDAKIEYVYPKDIHGRALPPAEYLDHLNDVLRVGGKLHQDIDRFRANDPKLKALQAEVTDVSNQLTGFGGVRQVQDPIAREALSKRRRELQNALYARRQEIVMTALRQVREYGHEHHTDVAPAQGMKAPRTDWRARIAETDGFFPDDWVRTSSQHRLNVTQADRAYHQSFGQGPGPTTLAMNTDQPYHDRMVTGWRDYVAQVNVHEMGHRMEAMIPGLRELEFSFVRQQAMLTYDELEAPEKLKDIYKHSSYRPDEITFRDKWINSYTGKTYEVRSYGWNDDPAGSSWEVFQVGLEQALGSGEQYGNTMLDWFVLGILATLHRTDVK